MEGVAKCGVVILGKWRVVATGSLRSRSQFHVTLPKDLQRGHSTIITMIFNPGENNTALYRWTN